MQFTCTRSDELYHHGILGQKWGVRRFQNPDGTLTAAGERRYGYKKAYEDSKSEYKKSVETKGRYASDTIKLNKQMQFNKDQYKKEKTLSSVDANKVGKLEKQWKDDYVKKGLSERDASVLAHRKATATKLIVAAAGITAAAFVAYNIKKNRDLNIDSIIPMSTKLSRITTNNDKGVHDTFYAAYKKGDKLKYQGMLGLVRNMQAGDVYKKDIGLTNDIKVAGRKSSIEILKNLSKSDPSYMAQLKKDLSNTYGGTAKQIRTLRKAESSLKKGIIDGDVYDALNFSIVDRSTSVEKFKNAIKNAGFDAVKDINDSKLSGYNAKAPVIVFGTGKIDTQNIKVGKMNTPEIIAKFFGADALLKAGKPSTYAAGLAFAGYKISNNLSNKETQYKKEYEIIKKYKKDHPDSSLSDSEILSNYYTK